MRRNQQLIMLLLLMASGASAQGVTEASRDTLATDTAGVEATAATTPSDTGSETKYVLRGRITDDTGEGLINATIYDLTTQTGVLSDEHGRYSFFLGVGRHQLRATYIGCDEKHFTVDITADQARDIVLNTTKALKEVEVTATMNRAMLTTQTGKRTLTPDDISTEFAVLSSPDLIKALQRISGVASGMEMSSDIYVHGGNADENMFLIDGTSLYHTNHSMGLFSSFNTDIIKNVDFYKSGFPARYSGRVSSITDVHTRDGDLKKFHGLVSIGLLDGRLQFEGPIVKDRTSFNIAMRRSWLDVFLKPYYAIKNKRAGENTPTRKFDYMFYDLNTKITHHINDRQTFWVSVYGGQDQIKLNDHDVSSYTYENARSHYDTDDNMKWGKVNATAALDMQMGNHLDGSVYLLGCYSRSSSEYEEDDYKKLDDTKMPNSWGEKDNVTKMYDVGTKLDFKWHPVSAHSIRFGGGYTFHGFRPRSEQLRYIWNTDASIDTTHTHSADKSKSNEVNLYIEDEMMLTRNFSLNLGTSYTAMMVKDKTYHLFDPRFATKYQICPTLSVKASVTHMSQSIHRISSSLLSMPSDFWVPTTANIRPTSSWQYAAGIYGEPATHWKWSLEGFYKTTSHLLQYRNWMGTQPDAVDWDKDVTEGKGRSYGIEADVEFHTSRITATASYTLSWNKRFFGELYNQWYYDQFDNRHRLNLMGRFKLTQRISLTAAWCFHTGNRVTLPEQYALQPFLPGSNGDVMAEQVYTAPNNYVVPAYHRLDVGADFRHSDKRGHEHIWNVSVYNAYCHFNSMYVTVKRNEVTGLATAKSYGYLPIIPSFSYTFKF